MSGNTTIENLGDSIIRLMDKYENLSSQHKRLISENNKVSMERDILIDQVNSLKEFKKDNDAVISQLMSKINTAIGSEHVETQEVKTKTVKADDFAPVINEKPIEKKALNLDKLNSLLNDEE